MLAVILIAGLIFYEAFVATRALSNVQAMRENLAGSFAVVQSTTMSDEEKATAMQKASVTMISAVAMTAGKILAAVAASAVFLYIVSLFAWPFESLVEYSISPLPLAATIVFLSVYGFIRHGRRR